MGSVIFLPGILGSRLQLDGEEIWPPTAIEAKFGYGRIDQLLDPAVVAGPPIDTVLCFDIYRPILNDLEDIVSGNAGAPRRRFHPFGYDWRLDLRETAKSIAGRIDSLPADDRDEIRFVGHSMGCLVIRLILESGDYDARPWFQSIRSFTALAGPHQGAPTALVRAIGLEGTTGISGPDVKRLASDPRYPALYQLLPAPGMAAVLDGTANRMTELDLYDPAVAARLGLAVGNLRKAKATHRILASNRRPEHVEYVYLAGSGNDTWLRVDLIGNDRKARKGKEAGDGTVPLWSAIDPSRVHHAAPAAHDSVFRNEQLRTMLYFSLGARPAAAAFVSAGQKPLLSIFPTHLVYMAGMPVDLTVVPAMPAPGIDGSLVIEHADVERDAAVFAPYQRLALRYQGAPIERLSVRVGPMTRPGFYRVRFEGSHDLPAGGAAMFGVSDLGGASGE